MDNNDPQLPDAEGPEKEERAIWAICLDTRKFEIELFWKRFNQFWLINAALLAAFGVVYDKHRGISFLVACYGLVTSVAWVLICLGSKWWHSAWEKRVNNLDQKAKPYLFSKYGMDESSKERLFVFPLNRFSVTGVATAIAFFSCLIWLALACWGIMQASSLVSVFEFKSDYRYAVIFLVTILFCEIMRHRTRKPNDY